MPNRWLKEAYCSSDRIESVGEQARDCWVRLLVNADDHGLFDARPQIVASRCYPLKPDASKCARLLDELEKADLLRRYEAGGRPYLMITRWYERPRSAPKYPEPPAYVLNRSQLLTIANNSCSHDHDHDHDHGARGKRGQSKVSIPEGWKPKPATVERLSREFGLRVPEDVDRYVAAFVDACKAKDYRYANFDAAFGNCVRQDWPKFRQNVHPLLGDRKVAV